MDVMIAAMPFTGHVGPARRAAEALVARGHRVRIHTGSAFAAGVAESGAEAVPWTAAPDFDEHDLPAVFPAVGRGGPLGVLANLEHVFFRTGAGQAADLLAAFERRPWDVLLGDSLSLGAALAAERTGRPWATLSVVPLALPSRDLPPPGIPVRPARGPLGRLRDRALRGVVAVAMAPLRRALRDARLATGLAPRGRPLADALFSPELVLALGVPGLEPERRDLPGHVVHIGAFPPPDVAERPAWWSAALGSGRPIVHVTQGTFDLDPRRLLVPAVAALRGPGRTVVAATGPGTGDAVIAGPGVHVGGLLPYGELLPRTAVMVTNGGWGGVLAALSCGVPLVVAGADLDKPLVAALVARSGAGIDLRTGDPSAAAIAAAVERVERHPRYRTRAAELAGEFAPHDAGAELVARLERLADADPRGARSTGP